MKYSIRTHSQADESDCYKQEHALWVKDAEIEGSKSKSKGACAVLEIAVNGVFVTIGDDEEED